MSGHFLNQNIYEIWRQFERPYCIQSSAMGYSIIVLSGAYDVESENHSKISGHMTSGEREFLIPVSAGFWREL